MHEEHDFTPPDTGGVTTAEDPAPPTRHVGRALAIIAATVAVFAVIVLTRSGAGRPSPVRVPIELRGWAGGPTGVLPVVRVRIGDGPPVPVLLDTGSTGLNMLAKDLPPASHAVPLGTVTETWGGGNVTRGRQALATVSIGGLTTPHPITMGIVEPAGCTPAAPHCRPWLSSGVDGILGVRVDPRSALANPLSSLSEPYGQTWRIALTSTRGTLELGRPATAAPDGRVRARGRGALPAPAARVGPKPTRAGAASGAGPRVIDGGVTPPVVTGV